MPSGSSPAGPLPGSVDVRGKPAEVMLSTAPPLASPLVAVKVRLPATQARVTVVVATPLLFVMVGVVLILSALDGVTENVQSTDSPIKGLPSAARIKVALTVRAVLHVRVPLGPATVTVSSFAP